VSFILTSTTDSQQALDAAAASENWKTPPVLPAPPPVPGDVPADLPQKKFSELREREIQERKEAGPEILQGDEARNKLGRGSGYQKRLDKLVRNWKAAVQNTPTGMRRWTAPSVAT